MCQLYLGSNKLNSPDKTILKPITNCTITNGNPNITYNGIASGFENLSNLMSIVPLKVYTANEIINILEANITLRPSGSFNLNARPVQDTEGIDTIGGMWFSCLGPGFKVWFRDSSGYLGCQCRPDGGLQLGTLYRFKITLENGTSYKSYMSINGGKMTLVEEGTLDRQPYIKSNITKYNIGNRRYQDECYFPGEIYLSSIDVKINGEQYIKGYWQY